MQRKLADQVNIYVYIRRHERLVFLPALEDVKQKHVRGFPLQVARCFAMWWPISLYNRYYSNLPKNVYGSLAIMGAILLNWGVTEAFKCKQPALKHMK